MSKRIVITERIRRAARRAHVEVEDGLIDRLCVYVELLRRWNERMNLTALDDRESGLERLVVEPLAAAGHLPATTGRLIDIGSGGGSPAIPMKLAAPRFSLVMVEAKTRKSAFLREACRQLGLQNASVETERYETLLTRPDLHESHDVLSVRAVRVDSRLLHGLQAFVRPQGEVFLFRGGGVGDVPNNLRPPLVWKATYPLGSGGRSCLVVLRKLELG